MAAIQKQNRWRLGASVGTIVGLAALGSVLLADPFRPPISVSVLVGRATGVSTITVTSLLPASSIASTQTKVFDPDGRLRSTTNAPGNGSGAITLADPQVVRGQRVQVQALVRDLTDTNRTAVSQQTAMVRWLPDLAVTAMSASSPYFANETGTITVTVKELNGDTGASVNLVLREGSTTLAIQPLTLPAAGAATATFTPMFVASGAHALTATMEGITPSDDVASNNASGLTVTVLKRPDFAVTGATLSNPYYVDKAGTVTVTVKELNGDIGASANLVLREGSTVIDTQVVTVAAGGARAVAFAPTFTTTGVHDLSATLEGITPTDEVMTNNVLKLTVTVQDQTDFAIVAADSSESFYVGTVGTVIAKVQEMTGHSGAAANLVIKEDAEVLGSRTVAVGPGSQATEGVRVTFRTSGPHHVTVALENITPGDGNPLNNTVGVLIDVLPAIVGPNCSTTALRDALLGIELTPTAANLTPGQEVKFQAFGFYKADPWTPVDISSLVTWAVADDGRLSVSEGGVSSNGLLGLSRVTASLDGVSNYANVRVWDAVRLASQTGMKVTAPWNATHGTCQQLSAIATFNNNPSDIEDVTLSTKWSPGSLGGKIFQDGLFAIVGPASDNYFYNSVSGSLVPGGPQGIANAAVWGHLFSGSCADPRSPGALWGIRTNPNPVTLQVTEATRITARGRFADGSLRDISDTVHFTTNSATVLETAQDGITTGLAPGIGAVVAVQGDIAGESCVTVGATAPLGNLTAISLEQPNANPVLGARLLFTALGTYDAQPGRLFNVTPLGTWTSGDSTITSPTHGIGLAENVGRTSVAVSVGWVMAEANVRVWDPAQVAALRSLRVVAGQWHMAAGTCQQLRSWAEFDGYPTEEITEYTIWRLLPKRPANVSTTGFFCPIGGDAYWYLTASFGRGVLKPTPITIGVWFRGI